MTMMPTSLVDDAPIALPVVPEWLRALLLEHNIKADNWGRTRTAYDMMQCGKPVDYAASKTCLSATWLHIVAEGMQHAA